VTLFNSPALRPPTRLRRYTIRALGVVITIVLFVAFFPGYLWYPFVYYEETKTVSRFMNSVVSGNLQQAYQIWKPSPSYSLKDFQDDWAPGGYYGPVRSYRIGRPEHLKNSTATDIAVDVSPYQPYPEADAIKLNSSKTVHLWVNFKDQSITFPPY
jgi:hypothetical protein